MPPNPILVIKAPILHYPYRCLIVTLKGPLYRNRILIIKGHGSQAPASLVGRSSMPSATNSSWTLCQFQQWGLGLGSIFRLSNRRAVGLA